jgi:hypothetical protein
VGDEKKRKDEGGDAIERLIAKSIHCKYTKG